MILFHFLHFSFLQVEIIEVINHLERNAVKLRSFKGSFKIVSEIQPYFIG